MTINQAIESFDPHRVLDPGYMEAHESARRRQKMAAIAEDWAIEGDGMIGNGYRSAIEAHAAAQRISRERQLPIFGDPEKCAEDYPLLYERVSVLARLDDATFAAVAGYHNGRAL